MLTLEFINVGYGDAILIRDTAAEFHMLVDCGDVTVGDDGPGSARVSAAEFLKREGIRTLDLLVLTHLHRDHSGGLTRLLRDVGVREFWTNYLPPQQYWGSRVPVPREVSAGARCLLESMNIYLEALKILTAQGTTIRLAEESHAAFELTPDLHAEAHLEDASLRRRQSEIWNAVLEGAPDGAILDELDGFINNTSIRLRLCWREKSVELPGDVYADCWERHQLAPCTIVKLPHHGHGDSMTPHLLHMLRPEHIVISVSNSRTDNCPAAEILQMLRQCGGQLHVTDAVRKAGSAPNDHSSVRFSFS